MLSAEQDIPSKATTTPPQKEEYRHICTYIFVALSTFGEDISSAATGCTNQPGKTERGMENRTTAGESRAGSFTDTSSTSYTTWPSPMLTFCRITFARTMSTRT